MRPSRLVVALLLALAALATACEPSIPEGVFACTADADCPPGLVCRALPARCFSTREPLPDGG